MGPVYKNTIPLVPPKGGLFMHCPHWLLATWAYRIKAGISITSEIFTPHCTPRSKPTPHCMGWRDVSSCTHHESDEGTVTRLIPHTAPHNTSWSQNQSMTLQHGEGSITESITVKQSLIGSSSHYPMYNKGIMTEARLSVRKRPNHGINGSHGHRSVKVQWKCSGSVWSFIVVHATSIGSNDRTMFFSHPRHWFRWPTVWSELDQS